jgi:hypothetical protein
MPTPKDSMITPVLEKNRGDLSGKPVSARLTAAAAAEWPQPPALRRRLTLNQIDSDRHGRDLRPKGDCGVPMFALVRSGLGGLLMAAVLAAAGGAEAATVNVFSKTYGRSQLGLAQAAMAAYQAGHTVSNLHVETFEGFRPWGSGAGTQDLARTGVGSFTPFGTKGTGRAVVGDGASLQVRSDNHMAWGRYNTSNTPPLPPGLADGNWLDSNDNLGMKWRISGLGGFNTLAFFVIDAADVGGSFSLKIGNRLYSDLNGGKRLKNGNIHLVEILLPRTRYNLTVRLMHDRSDDGFGIDGALIAQVVPPSPVPLPPAAALLVPALALLAGLRRTKRRA